MGGEICKKTKFRFWIKNRKVSDFYSKTSKYLGCKFSSRPICPNLDFNGL